MARLKEMKDQKQQIVYRSHRRYTRSVRQIWMRPDGFTDTPHGIVRISGQDFIVKLDRDLTNIFQRNVWDVVYGRTA